MVRIAIAGGVGAGPPGEDAADAVGGLVEEGEVSDNDGEDIDGGVVGVGVVAGETVSEEASKVRAAVAGKIDDDVKEEGADETNDKVADREPRDRGPSGLH